MCAESFHKSCPICETDRASHERILGGVELLKCDVCGFVYANLTDEYILQYNSNYDQAAVDRYEATQTFLDTAWFERITKKITKMAGGSGSVLDIGCGNGALLRQFLAHQWSAYGIDVSPWAQEQARNYGYTVYLSELENAGLPDDDFDAVTSTAVLEHIARPYQHVKEIVRVLKPGGIAYIMVPNYGSITVRLNVSSFSSNTPPGHVNYFTPQTMRRLFLNPEIAGKIARLSITTYGVPELYRIYGLFNRISLRKVARSTDNDKGSVISESLEERKQDTKSWLKKALSSFVTTFYYYIGRPLCLGDKLEVIVVKK